MEKNIYMVAREQRPTGCCEHKNHLATFVFDDLDALLCAVNGAQLARDGVDSMKRSSEDEGIVLGQRREAGWNK